MEERQNQLFIEGLNAGDKKVFKQIFDTYYKNLVITSYQILKDENICRDAAQEVFLDLWKNREKMHDKIFLRPYLKRSIINRSLNILKSRKHHMSSGEEPLSVLSSKTRQPDEIYQDEELKEVVFSAIDSMPERCRAIFMLCRIEGLRHAEIAKKLEISTKTIENQMTKGLKIVREAISNYHNTMAMLGIIFFLRWGILGFDLFCQCHLA